MQPVSEQKLFAHSGQLFVPTTVSFQAKCLIQEFNITDLGAFGCELLSVAVYVNNAKSQGLGL